MPSPQYAERTEEVVGMGFGLLLVKSHYGKSHHVPTFLIISHLAFTLGLSTEVAA